MRLTLLGSLIMQTHYKKPLGCKWEVKGTNKKRGGTASKDRILILSGKMSPLSAEVYIHGGQPNLIAGWRVDTTKSCPSAMELSRRGHIAMASAQCLRIALILFLFTANFVGVFSRTVGMQKFLPQPLNVGAEHGRPTLRTHLLRRWRREIMESHRGRCTELTMPWMEAAGPPVDFAEMYRLRVRSYQPGVSQRIVFPEQSLIRFIRRIYHCCQVRPHCRSVKGIQGHLRSDKNVEFFLTREVLSVDVIQAEIHLQLLNPHGLDITPSIPFMTKRNLPTRYSLWSKDDTVEMRVDLLFLFRGLQEAAGVARGGSSLLNMRRVGVLSSGGPRERPAQQSLQDTDGELWGDGLGHLLTAQELGLALSCSKGGLGVACEPSGVHLLHTPFIALTYSQ